MLTVKEEFLRCDKVRRAVKSGGPAIVLVWLALKTYASEHLTDGFIPDEDVDAVDALVDARCRRAALDALVSCGRLRPDGTRGAGLVERVAGGYQLHDYLEHEQSADDARARRLLKAKRQKRWRDSRRVDAVDARVDAPVDARCATTETPTRRAGDAPPTRARAHDTSPLLSSPLLSSGSEILPVEDPVSVVTRGGPGEHAPLSLTASPAPTRRTSSKPIRIPQDWKPSDRQVAALATKHGVAPERVAAEVAEFVWYWAEGGGSGKLRSTRGWEQAFGNRVDEQAKRGVLFAAPSERNVASGSSSADRIRQTIEQFEREGSNHVPY